MTAMTASWLSVLLLVLGAGVGFFTGARVRRNYLPKAVERLRTEIAALSLGGISSETLLWLEQLRKRVQRLEAEQCPHSEPGRSERLLLGAAARLLPPSERDRYLEEFRAELLDVPGDTRLSHALSLLRGVLVLRLRRGLKKEAADAVARRAKD